MLEVSKQLDTQSLVRIMILHLRLQEFIYGWNVAYIKLHIINWQLRYEASTN